MRLSIHVLESHSGLSMVTSDGRLPPIQSFAHKCHAVAFGRALAFSLSLPLWVYGDDGVAVRQPPESLTYPTRLSGAVQGQRHADNSPHGMTCGDSDDANAP
jgi:hypothetical protein